MSLDVSKLNYEFIILRRLEYIRPETFGNGNNFQNEQIHKLYLATKFKIFLSECPSQCGLKKSDQYINDFLNFEIPSLD